MSAALNARLTLVLRIFAWALFVGLVVVTLGPIDMRPVSPLPVQVERASAVAFIGLVFALAYPRHIVLVTILVLGSACLLEALQLIDPGRHGRLSDMLAKVAGGTVGLLCGHLVNLLRHRSTN
jgi:hypothetical protein